VQVVANKSGGRKAFVTHFGGVFEACAAERKYSEGNQEPFCRSLDFDEGGLFAKEHSGLKEKPGHHEKYQAAPKRVQGLLPLPQSRMLRDVTEYHVDNQKTAGDIGVELSFGRCDFHNLKLASFFYKNAITNDK
jgi:hypothetical protein